MRRLSLLIVGLVWFGVSHHAASGQEKKKEEFKSPLPKIVVQPAPSFKHLDGQLLVFVANGVSGSTTVSDNLLELNSDMHLGLRIQMVPWTRTLSLKGDLVDHEAQINAAAKIACSIKEIRKDAPNAHIYLVGSSAGARVVLATAEMAPPKSIDRVITLSPAVSRGYDLTGAIKATRYGIDNFYSTFDGLLDPENAHYRNADGAPGHAAGKFGFTLCSTNKEDVEAYRLVRQYPWNENYHGSGGHPVWTIRHNLKKAVVPLFFCAPAPPPMMKLAK